MKMPMERYGHALTCFYALKLRKKVDARGVTQLAGCDLGQNNGLLKA
jgi:hypothetical protein